MTARRWDEWVAIGIAIAAFAALLITGCMDSAVTAFDHDAHVAAAPAGCVSCHVEPGRAMRRTWAYPLRLGFRCNDCHERRAVAEVTP